MKSVFRLSKSNEDGKFYFHLRNPDGETIGSSKGYDIKRFAVYDIIAVKKDASLEDRYEISSGDDNLHYVCMKNASGDTLLMSNGYESRQKAEEGKEAIRRYAPDSETEDMTGGAVV